MTYPLDFGFVDKLRRVV